MSDHVFRALRRQLNLLTSILRNEDDERAYFGRQSGEARQSDRNKRRTVLQRLLKANNKLSAKQLQHLLKSEGYTVSLQQVYRDLRVLRP